MVQNRFEISTYYVNFMREIGNSKASAGIMCAKADMSSKLYIGFIPEGVTAPNNYTNSTASYGIIYVPDERYSWYIDLLRSEKPVFARIDSKRPINHAIYTGREPVGEEEEASVPPPPPPPPKPPTITPMPPPPVEI